MQTIWDLLPRFPSHTKTMKVIENLFVLLKARKNYVYTITLHRPKICDTVAIWKIVTVHPARTHLTYVCL